MFDLMPDSAGSYLLTARMLFRQEFEPVALEYAQKAVALDPKLPRAHFLLGEIHLFESKIPEAISDFQAELSLNPSDAATYYKLADAYSRIQKFDDAEKLLQRAIWLDPTSTGPYIPGKAGFSRRKAELELAVRALRHAAAMDPNNSVTPSPILPGQAYRAISGIMKPRNARPEIASELQSAADSKP